MRDGRHQAVALNRRGNSCRLKDKLRTCLVRPEEGEA